LEQFSILRSNRLLSFRVIGEGKPLFIVGFSDYTFDLLPKRIQAKYKCILHNYYGSLNHTTIDDIDLSLENLLFDIEAIRKYLQLPKINILGHSSAGTVALDYTLRFSSRINKAVLLCSPPIYNDRYVEFQRSYMAKNLESQRRLYMENLKQELKTIQSQNPKKSWFAEYHNAQRPLYFYDYQENWDTKLGQYQFNQEFINHFIEKTYQKYKRENEISSVLSKLIVILGRYDFAVPVTSWDGYEIDSAIFEKSSHYPMIEEAEAFTEKLIDRMRAT
jgi:pimeloyl-ACP methyl ester carboxylesterase